MTKPKSASTLKSVTTPKQDLFLQMVLGVLVYAVVLGFFNDYTDILNTTSYSTTFMVAVVMQILTYLTLELKKKIAKYFKSKNGKAAKVWLVLSVWLVMFFSKFVFLAVLDFIFGKDVEISGFIGLVLIIMAMLAGKFAIDLTYRRLGQPKSTLLENLADPQ